MSYLFFILIFQTSAITQRISPCSTLTSSTASPPASSPCSTLPPVSTNATAKDCSYGAVTSPTSTLESRDSGIIGELVFILIISCLLFFFLNNDTSLRFSKKNLILNCWNVYIKCVLFIMMLERETAVNKMKAIPLRVATLLKALPDKKSGG